MPNTRLVTRSGKDRGGTVALDVSEPIIYVSVRSANPTKNRKKQRPGSSKLLNEVGFAPSDVDLSERVVKFEINPRSKRATKLELTFWNEDLALNNSPIMQKGALITVRFGYSGFLSSRKVFRISKIKGSRARVKSLGQLKIVAYGQSMDFNNGTKSKTWKNIKVNDIARKIARSYGISDQDMLLDPSQTQKISVAHQVNQSDAQFLISLSSKLGWIFKMEDGVFTFAPHPFVDQCKPISYYTYFTDENGWIKDFKPESAVLNNPGSVTVKSIDPKTRKNVSYTATVQTSKMRSMGRYVNVKPTEKKSGGKVIHREKTVSRPGVLPSNKVIHKPLTSASGVKKEAEGRMQNALHKGNKARIVLIGDPSIWKDVTIRLDNVGEGFNGIWRVSEAKHTIDSSGYTVEAELTRNATNSLNGNQRPTKNQKTKSQFPGRRSSGRVRGRTTNTKASYQGVRKRTRYKQR